MSSGRLGPLHPATCRQWLVVERYFRTERVANTAGIPTAQARATVTVDGAATTVGADGTFETTVPLSAQGEISAEVRSGTHALAPRTVHVALKRVASLVDEAHAARRPVLRWQPKEK